MIGLTLQTEHWMEGCLAAMVKKVVADLPVILQQLHDKEDAFYQYSKYL